MTNFQIEPCKSTPVNQLHFEPLNKKYIKVHITATLIIYLAAMAVMLLLLLTNILWICIVAECVVSVVCIANVRILPKAFKYKGYAIREHDISYRSGIFFPAVTTIPFTRIQQISVKQNPISKFYNMFSVEIVNGAQEMESITIPGFTEDKANRIKNLLIEYIRNE